MSAFINIISQSIEAINHDWFSNDEQFFILKGISTQIETPDRRDEAFKLLCRIQSGNLRTHGGRMYYHYLKAKYFRMDFDTSGNYDRLEQAEGSIQKVFEIGREHGVNVHSPKYYFARAYIYFLLAKHASGEGQTKQHYKLLSALSDLTSRFTNSSANWLYNEVRTFALANDLQLP